MPVPDTKPEPAPPKLSGALPVKDAALAHADGAPATPAPPTELPPEQAADSGVSHVNHTDPPNHEPSVQSPVSRSPAHITRPISPPSPQPQSEDVTMAPADAPNPPPEPTQSPAPPALVNHQPAPPPIAPAPPVGPKSPDNGTAAPPSLENHAPHPADIPLTMVQTSGQSEQGLSARQLGQRARRARERELQAQGLYTPKRRTSSSATQPDLSPYVSHAAQPGALPVPTPPAQAAPTTGDVTMQSPDGDGDDDGEGELEADLAPQSVGASVLSASTPAVPPHTASHLIPPIAVLAPVATPSRASLAQRARRERERANRLGLTPGAAASPEGSSGSSTAPLTYASPQPPIPFNPQQVPPGSTHLAALGQVPQQPPTLTRGQLAQRARRARERVERASKTQNSDGWTPSLNTQEGVSSAGEAVFAVAPPPPSANGQPAGFVTTASQHNPGYGVGLGANHVPQQLNRAQLAQRARRARERQQRLATAAAHATNASDVHRSPSSSVPPASPTAKKHMDEASRSSLSPMASSATAPAPLSIGAQFAQVFKSLTAGDNGVSRAVADAGALTSKDDMKARNSTNSPIERMTSPTSGQRTDNQDGPDECMDQLSEDSTHATTPSRDAAPTSPRPDVKAQSPPPEPTTTVQERVEPGPLKAATPEVHMASVQSVGA
ncbi:hypothetical protein FRC10_006182 [Ceratobasidium sp. 414]|nr:hypothetical protein FRC10_006182 [Ceratobasidium sp. 414]